MTTPERRVGDRRCHDPAFDPNLIHLTAGKLWAILLLVWFTSIFASGGVGWYFAGRSAHETTKALASSSVNGQQSLYQSSLGRCLTGSDFRSTVIHNALLQKQTNPTVQVPKKGESCASQIPNPLAAGTLNTAVNPSEATAVG